MFLQNIGVFLEHKRRHDLAHTRMTTEANGMTVPYSCDHSTRCTVEILALTYVAAQKKEFASPDKATRRQCHAVRGSLLSGG
jgi:hypothetical protein